jgi:hypothetical protein
MEKLFKCPLREFSVESVWQAISQNQGPLLAMLLAHVALVAFLANTFTTQQSVWVFNLLLILAAINLLRHYRQAGAVFWLISLALVLFTLYINGWWYSIVGDEFIFFDYACDIAQKQNWLTIGENLFRGDWAYGMHPYLSSLIQAVLVKLLGCNNFGWRFSSLYLSALAVGLFYLFKTFVPRRVALVAALFLACSHYIMTFGKIGYNNLSLTGNGAGIVGGGLGAAYQTPASQWGIGGLETLRRIYAIPAPPVYLTSVIVKEGKLHETARPLLLDPGALIVVKLWLDPQWKASIEDLLRELNKSPCNVKTINGTGRFQIWQSGGKRCASKVAD